MISHYKFCDILTLFSMNTSSFSVVREINNAEDAGSTTEHNQRELLFQKALTPSDVGKLNRLVIPKQYAEKYFPLRSVSGRSNDGGSGESLLIFEDEVGKIWRFRYSYWTSSQSYVLTKGWSGYVKEKDLTAGDIVSFQRQQCNKSDQITNRLFIAWRSRLQSTGTTERIKHKSTGDYWSTPTAFFPAPQPYRPLHPAANLSHKYTGGENLQLMSISSTPRRLRLFGVNMEFIESDQSSDVASSALTFKF